jgi:hypothetical protein
MGQLSPCCYDGRIELDNNTVERSIRKSALFAGPDGGADHWAVIASLIETCKLNDVEAPVFGRSSNGGFWSWKVENALSFNGD